VDTTIDGLNHASEFAKELMPKAMGEAMVCQVGVEELVKPYFYMCWKMDCTMFCVQVPTKNHLLCGPVGVALENF